MRRERSRHLWFYNIRVDARTSLPGMKEDKQQDSFKLPLRYIEALVQYADDIDAAQGTYPRPLA
jgi:hypothetical protein